MLRTLCPTAVLALACFANAQRLNAYGPLPGMFAEVQPVNPLTGAPSPPLLVYPAIPPLPPAPAFVVPPGDSTFDGIAGVNVYTNGILFASTPTPNYPPLGPLFPPAPIGPAALAAIGGPVTGMAINPIAGILWLVSAPGIVVGTAPVPGTPILFPPFPIPFPTGPIVGLDWDGMTGTLLAVDVTATVFTFFPGGPPALPPIVPPVPPPGIPGDVAIDKTGMLNAAAMRPRYVAVGPACYDVTLPVPLFFPLGPVPPAVGLAFQEYPAQSLPFGGCACGAMLPVVGTTGPMTAGNLGFGLTLGAVAPGSLVLFGLDFVFNPAFPLINLLGCPLGLVLGSPTLVAGLTFANAAGVATYGLPLAVPPGFGPLYTQAFTLCPLDPAGFIVAPMQQVVASGV